MSVFQCYWLAAALCAFPCLMVLTKHPRMRLFDEIVACALTALATGWLLWPLFVMMLTREQRRARWRQEKGL